MKLYKYLPPSRIDVIEGQKICFSLRHQLNDPYEWTPVVEKFLSLENITEQIKRNASQPSLPQTLTTSWEEYGDLEEHAKVVEGSMNEFLTNLMKPELDLRKEVIESKLGVLCLSENPDDFLMWAHYASSHTGFIIEFDSEHVFFNHPTPVAPEHPYIAGGVGVIRRVDYYDERPVAEGYDKLTYQVEFFSKSHHWQY